MERKSANEEEDDDILDIRHPTAAKSIMMIKAEPVMVLMKYISEVIALMSHRLDHLENGMVSMTQRLLSPQTYKSLQLRKVLNPFHLMRHFWFGIIISR